MYQRSEIIDKLRQYLGKNVSYQGTIYEVMEILEETPALVLQDCEHHTTIQADQHGEAHRRVPKTRTITIPVDEDGRYDIAEVGIEPVDEKIFD